MVFFGHLESFEKVVVGIYCRTIAYYLEVILDSAIVIHNTVIYIVVLVYG